MGVEFDKVLILKIVALVILFIAFVVGTVAHAESFWDANGSHRLEFTFCVFTGMSFFMSLIMLILVLAGVGGDRMKRFDGSVCFSAGILSIIAGILMIVAAILLDAEHNKSSEEYKYGKISRNEYRFYNKLVAGVLAIIAGILYGVVFFMLRC